MRKYTRDTLLKREVWLNCFVITSDVSFSDILYLLLTSSHCSEEKLIHFKVFTICTHHIDHIDHNFDLWIQVMNENVILRTEILCWSQYCAVKSSNDVNTRFSFSRPILCKHNVRLQCSQHYFIKQTLINKQVLNFIIYL